MDAVLDEYPPVANVVIECIKASNPLIPASQSIAVHIKVRLAYTPKIPPANCRARGIALSLASYVSVLNNCIPPIDKIGKIAKAITMIPIPPSH